MIGCKLSKAEIDCLQSFGFSFDIPCDLAELKFDDLKTIAKTIDKEGMIFINDEPTEICFICERILDKIQDNLYPDIYDLINAPES